VAAPTLSEKVRTALLALEGTVIDDLRLPVPGDLRDISKAAAMVSGVVEDRIPALLNGVRDRTWDEDGALHEYEFRRFPIGFPDVLLVERANPENILFQLERKGAQPPSVREGSSDLGPHRRRGRPAGLFEDC